MEEYCTAAGIPWERCGKVVVASLPDEVPALAALAERGRQNGLEVEELSAAGLAEHEPHAVGLASIFVPATGVVDYKVVCQRLADEIVERGGRVLTGVGVTSAIDTGTSVVVRSDVGPVVGRPRRDLRRRLVRRADRGRRREAHSPHHPVPGRVPRAHARGLPPGQAPHLPGARRPLPVPRGALHPRHRRARPRRAERRSRLRPRRLLLDPLPPDRHRPLRRPAVELAPGREVLAHRRRRDRAVAAALEDGRRAAAPRARREVRGPRARRRRRARPGHQPRRHTARRLRDRPQRALPCTS